MIEWEYEFWDYLECARWVAELEAYEFSQQAIDKASGDWLDFYKAFEKLVKELDLDINDFDMKEVQRDFYLTCNYHGTGFWDRDYSGKVGDALTELSQSFVGSLAWLGEDNLVYLE